MRKKVAVLGMILIIIFSSFFIYPVNGIKTMAFKKGLYKLDGEYIIDIPGYTTVKKFKSNIYSLFKVKVEGVTKEDKEYIKTGDTVKVGTKTYTAVVTGDIDSDGKCTYKDILMEQWLYDNPNSDLVEYAKMIKSRRASRLGPTGSAEDILQTAKEVSQWMIDTGNQYSLSASQLIIGDIEKASKNNYYCCATFVAVVLYKSGMLTAEHINKYRYNWTGDGGIPDMLKDAGWYQVPASEAQPGDVLNNYTIHVMICAGDNLIYDQQCAQDYNTVDPRSCDINPNWQVWRAPYTNSSNSDQLHAIIEAAQKNAISVCGGDWAIYAESLDSNEKAQVNSAIMKAASLIKLYIMGAVYEDYDKLKSKYSSIDNDLYNMITVSDNTAANNLVTLLGNGDSSVGKDKVTKYCSSHGYTSTSMKRMLLASTATGDNYTSVSDCGKFLKSVYKGELPHSKDMLNLLKKQQRTGKIPAGVTGVQTANKTGELYGENGDYAENDAAIIFAEKPYVLVVMSNKKASLGDAVGQIQSISKKVYNYFK